MLERLAKNGREFEEQTKEHINEYADAGLRTLVLAYRELDEDEYNEFNQEFTEAKNSVSSEREEMIEEVAAKIERDLILVGATAVEDKLQNGVSYRKGRKLSTQYYCGKIKCFHISYNKLFLSIHKDKFISIFT